MNVNKSRLPENFERVFFSRSRNVVYEEGIIPCSELSKQVLTILMQSWMKKVILELEVLGS